MTMHRSFALDVAALLLLATIISGPARAARPCAGRADALS